MKAWKVRDPNERTATIVFAETAGKARSLAMHTDCCEDMDFCAIEVRRAPAADMCYRAGTWEMDWYDSDDRLVMVRDLGFTCEYKEPEECAWCPAKEYCDLYNEEG